MMLKSGAIALAALLLPGALAESRSAPAQPDIRTLLDSALRGPRAPFAASQRTRIALDGGGAAATTVDLRVDGKGSLLREYRDGAARGAALLQVGKRLWQRSPNGSWARLPDSAESDPALMARLIVANYRVTLLPMARAAGREATGLWIRPKRAANPSRRLWVEAKTGIVLKDELFAPDGRLRSSTEMVSIAAGPQMESLFRPPTHSSPNGLFGPSSFSPRPTATQVERETGRPVLLPGFVPQGYRIVLYGVMVTGSGRLMPVVRYSDGLSAFTIFQRGRGPGGGGRGMGRWADSADEQPASRCVGTSGIQQAVVAVTGGRSNYLLVGDLAESELKRVGQSLP